MRRTLDIMFGNKKLSITIPLCINVIMLLLTVLFGNPASSLDTILSGLLISTVCFLGIYFILIIQIKNPSCPDWFLNLFELLITCVFVFYAIVDIIKLFASGFESFKFSICLGLITYSATALAHSKRK